MNDFDWEGPYADFLAEQMQRAILGDWRERLRRAIHRTGKKQSAIAKEAGMTPATLSRILTGCHADPKFHTIVRIAHACGEHVGYLLGEQPFTLSGEQRAKVRAAAGILMDLTGGRSK
ncbi:MAG TPA: helix-turn-helix transcriptional regulator [Burkholderiales bacterium]|jgi:transcriptional regulator with XRE-family HTH domain|nr:helix-turn-helix transcriptional regulator [Burkholderiales bacterium]